MATSSLNARKLKPERQELRGRNNCIFSVNRGPVTTQKRDKSQFEDHRQRAFVGSMQNAFRTISFRSEPTVGEENLTRRSTSRKAGEMISQTQAPGKTNYTLMNKKSEELLQNFVPECYEHILNFHHYRSDIARLNSGFKVLYLSGNKDEAEKETNLRRVYGQKSKTPKGKASSINRHCLKLPGRKITSTRKANTVATKEVTSSQNIKEKGSHNSNKNNKMNSKEKLTSFRARVYRQNFMTTDANLNTKQRQHCKDDQKQPNIQCENEQPCFKHGNAPVEERVENQPSLHIIASDIRPNPPMTTPEDLSRRSSIRTLVFEGEDVSDGKKATMPAPQTKSHRKVANQRQHYLAPFHSRFPHLKASSAPTSSSQMRQKRFEDFTAVPSWQQYRILCDAFRPSTEMNFYQKFKRPKFATATELEYYIDIVSETTNDSSLHML